MSGATPTRLHSVHRDELPFFT